jgi:hypothetical protein
MNNDVALRAWSRTSLSVFAFTGGCIGWLYIAAQLNLPEQLVPYLATGVGLGLVLGRWWAPAGSVIALGIPLTGEPPISDLTWAYAALFYLPVGAIAIAIGVAVRKVVQPWLRR